jgi:hypothetical protein
MSVPEPTHTRGQTLSLTVRVEFPQVLYYDLIGSEAHPQFSRLSGYTGRYPDDSRDFTEVAFHTNPISGTKRQL